MYKLGRSDQAGLKRLKDYEKDYELILVIACEDSIKVESDLIKLFNRKYKKHIKNEYFGGEKKDMMDDIYNRIRGANSSVLETGKYSENSSLIKFEYNCIDCDVLLCYEPNCVLGFCNYCTQKRMSEHLFNCVDCDALLLYDLDTKTRVLGFCNRCTQRRLFKNERQEKVNPVMLNREHVRIPSPI